MKKNVIKVMTVSAVCLVGSFANQVRTEAANSTLFSVTASVKSVPVTSVQLVPASTLLVGETYQYKAMISPKNATDQTLKWYSQNENVVKVNGQGLVTATGKGKADIYAFASDGVIRGWSEVTVKEGDLPIASVTLSPKSGTVEVGTPFTLTGTVLPEGTKQKYVTWSSSNTSVATVKEGIVTGLKPGSVTITGVSADGKKKDTSKLTVKYGSTIPVNSVALTPNKSLLVGETHQYTATILPAIATDKSLTWSSQNSSVAKVDANGLVTATGIGKTDIYAFASDGVIRGWSEVTVKEGDLPIAGVTLSPKSGTVEVGTPFTLTGTVLPEGTKQKYVTWSSSNTSIATVKEGVVTGLKPGTVTITGLSADGKKKDTSVLTVKYGAIVPISAITLTPKAKTLAVGKSFQYKAVISPSVATETTVNWYTLDRSIATIDDKGLVKALKKGKTDVYAYSKDGTIRDWAELTVK